MRGFLAGALLVFVLAVAGCGGGSSPSSSGNGEASKPARQVLADAAHAAEGASSFHMSGQMPTTDGQRMGLDLMIVNGKGARGSLTPGGHKIPLIVVGTDAYMKLGAGFWRELAGSSGGATLQQVAGKWLKFPMTNAHFAAFTRFTNLKSVFDSMTSTHGSLTNKGATTYKGQSVVAIDVEGGTLYVAATGTPYPVAIVDTRAGVSVSFDNWGQSVSLTAPSGAIAVSKLGG